MDVKKPQRRQSLRGKAMEIRGNYIMNRRKKEEWSPKIIHRFKDGTVMTAEEFNKNPPTVPADHPASLALVRISHSMMEAG